MPLSAHSRSHQGGKKMNLEAVTLAMGEYLYCPDRSMPEVLPPPSASGMVPASFLLASSSTLLRGNSGIPSQGQGAKLRRLKLFQILSPGLVGRAKVFGSKLALKEEWVCIDPPYFNAPGVNVDSRVRMMHACRPPTRPRLHGFISGL